MPTVNLVSSKSTAWSGYFTYSYTQSISGNYSDVDIKVYAIKEDGYKSGTNSGTWDVSITVAGTTKTLGSAGGYALPYSGYYCYGSDTGNDTASFRVYHNNDGTVSCNVSISAYPPSGLSWSGESLTYSGKLSLPTIPRASSISAANAVYFGSACSITWTPLSSSFYYKLKFSIGSWSYTTAAIKPGTTSSYSYTGYTIPYAAANQIPNTVSGTMSVALYSYNSSACTTQIGSTSTSSFTVTLPDSVKPTISTCTVTKDNSANSVVAGWGIALAGYTKVNIAATAAGAYGSTITGFNISGSYRAALTGDSLDYTGGIITSSGNKQFMVTCTDSRGRVSSTFTSDIIAFTAYSLPKVKKLTMSKNDSGKMVATSTWTYDTVDGKNTATAKVYYKVTTAEDWTVHSGTLTNGTAFTLSNLTPNEESSYNFKVVVTDALGNSAEKDAFSSTVTVLLDFKAGGDGLGVGKICEDAGMEVSMEAVFFNEIYIKNRQQTLEDYIRSIMKTVSEDMYGDIDASSAIPNPSPGQIYFKRVT